MLKMNHDEEIIIDIDPALEYEEIVGEDDGDGNS